MGRIEKRNGPFLSEKKRENVDFSSETAVKGESLARFDESTSSRGEECEEDVLISKKRRRSSFSEDEEDVIARICDIWQSQAIFSLLLMPPLTPRNNKFSNFIFSSPPYFCMLVGTSKFLELVGQNLGLSSTTICTALYYLNTFYEHFELEETERRCVAGACLLLAWKYREDIEVTRRTRKLQELPRVMYRVLFNTSLCRAHSIPADTGASLEDGQMDVETERERAYSGSYEVYVHPTKPSQEEPRCSSTIEYYQRRSQSVCSDMEASAKPEEANRVGSMEHTHSSIYRRDCDGKNRSLVHYSEGAQEGRFAKDISGRNFAVADGNALTRQMAADARNGCKGYELLSTQNSHITEEDTQWMLSRMHASSQWILNDSGETFSGICERIKMYESGLLRAINYNIGPIVFPFQLLHSYCRRFIMTLMRASSHPKSPQKKLASSDFHTLRSKSSLLLTDCYKTPICLEYNVRILIVLCIWRAALLLNILFESNAKLEGNAKKLSSSTWREDVEMPSSSVEGEEGSDSPEKHPIASKLEDAEESAEKAAFRRLNDYEELMKKFLSSLFMNTAECMNKLRCALRDTRQMYDWMSLFDLT